MALFKVGDRISLKENVNHKGEIQFVHPISRNIQYYDILFDDNNESTRAEYEIVNEVKTQSAWSIFSSGHLFDHENFKIANTIHKVQNTSANTLSTFVGNDAISFIKKNDQLIKNLIVDGGLDAW